MVNITSKQGHSETTTVLAAGEHPYIKKPSVVFYADARTVTAAQIDDVIAEGYGKPHKSCSVDLIVKIQKGLLESSHVKPRVKEAFMRALEEGRHNPPLAKAE